MQLPSFYRLKTLEYQRDIMKESTYLRILPCWVALESHLIQSRVQNEMTRFFENSSLWPALLVVPDAAHHYALS